MIAVEADFENNNMKIMDPAQKKFIDMNWNAILESKYRNIYRTLNPPDIYKLIFFTMEYWVKSYEFKILKKIKFCTITFDSHMSLAGI